MANDTEPDAEAQFMAAFVRLVSVVGRDEALKIAETVAAEVLPHQAELANKRKGK